MGRTGAFLRRQAPGVIFAAGMGLVLFIWGIDRLIPNQVSISIFYLIPVGFVAWFSGRRWAYAVSTASAAAWLVNDLAIARTYPYWIVPYWNAFVRLGFFAIVSYLAALVARMRRLHDAEASALKAAVETSQLKSRMISFVSHEFCNSLTTFKVALNLLKEADPDADGEERREWYEILDRVFVHLSSAAGNFLNLGRLESGRFKPEFQRTLLRPLIQGVISVLAPVVENRKVIVRFDFPEDPIPVRADPDALSMVMSNLIGNAVKYTPKGGTITIGIEACRDAPGEVEVSIKDTGIGIPKNIQEDIFSDYYRAEGGKIMAKGYGVGLKVARELLSVQGVELKLSSAPQKGSRFYFRLPALL